jgi:hypothetical protein
MHTIEIDNTVQQQEWDETLNSGEGGMVARDPATVAAEEQVLIDAKVAEIQAKVDAYEAAKAYQLANGGPGPVAEFEIMKICNEHSCNFEVVFKA